MGGIFWVHRQNFLQFSQNFLACIFIPQQRLAQIPVELLWPHFLFFVVEVEGKSFAQLDQVVAFYLLST